MKLSVDLARELLALKAAGVIANLWIDAGVVRVSYPADPTQRRYIAKQWAFVERMRRKAVAA